MRRISLAAKERLASRPACSIACCGCHVTWYGDTRRQRRTSPRLQSNLWLNYRAIFNVSNKLVYKIIPTHRCLGPPFLVPLPYITILPQCLWLIRLCIVFESPLYVYADMPFRVHQLVSQVVSWNYQAFNHSLVANVVTHSESSCMWQAPGLNEIVLRFNENKLIFAWHLRLIVIHQESRRLILIPILIVIHIVVVLWLRHRMSSVVYVSDWRPRIRCLHFEFTCKYLSFGSLWGG